MTKLIPYDLRPVEGTPCDLCVEPARAYIIRLNLGNMGKHVHHDFTLPHVSCGDYIAFSAIAAPWARQIGRAIVYCFYPLWPPREAQDSVWETSSSPTT